MSTLQEKKTGAVRCTMRARARSSRGSRARARLSTPTSRASSSSSRARPCPALVRGAQTGLPLVATAGCFECCFFADKSAVFSAVGENTDQAASSSVPAMSGEIAMPSRIAKCELREIENTTATTRPADTAPAMRRRGPAGSHRFFNAGFLHTTHGNPQLRLGARGRLLRLRGAAAGRALLRHAWAPVGARQSCRWRAVSCGKAWDSASGKWVAADAEGGQPKAKAKGKAKGTGLTALTPRPPGRAPRGKGWSVTAGKWVVVRREAHGGHRPRARLTARTRRR